MAHKAPAKKAIKKVLARKAVSGTRVRSAADKKAPKAAAVKARTAVIAAPVKPSVKNRAVAVVEAPKEIKKEKIVPLSKADLQYFRNLLLEKRQEIIGNVGSMESEAFTSGANLSNMPIHMADVGTDNFEQEFTLGLIESERQILREIQEALARLDDGSYGICQGTGRSIPRVRLEAMPWAKYTIEYKRLMDQGKVGEEEAPVADDDGGEEDEE